MKLNLSLLLLITSAICSYGQNKPIQMTSEFWNGANWVQQTRAQYAYYDNGDSNLTFWSVWDDANSDWKNTYLQTSVYGNDQRLLRQITDIWNGPNNQTGSYEDHTRQNNGYGAMVVSGNTYFFLSKELVERWNVVDQAWDTAEYRSSKPNINGLVDVTTERLNYAGTVMNAHKYKFFYDNQRRRTQQWTYNWSNGDWEEAFSTLWQHHISKDRIERVEVKNWNPSNSTFTLPRFRTDNIYDDNDKLDSAITYEWDNSASEYVKSGLYLALYDSKGRLAKEVFHNYNSGTNEWDAVNQNLYQYNDNTGVDDVNEITMTIYPNPASDYIRVQGAEIAEAHLYSMQGNHVPAELTHKGNYAELDVRSLLAGSYTMQLVLENGVTKVEQVLLNAQ